MQTASIIGLVKTLLIIYLFYYLIKLLFRILSPFIFKSIINKVNNRYNSDKFNSTSVQREGETVIDKKTNKKPKNDSHIGEYVDFEELDD